MLDEAKHRPQGATEQSDGSIVWRVWSPLSENISLVTYSRKGRTEVQMMPDNAGYFVCRLPNAEESMRYMYKLPDGNEYPDPASRWQPDGVHRHSAVFGPGSYRWSDAAWRGIPRRLGDLRITRGHFYAGGHIRSHYSAPAAISVAGRDRRGNHARPQFSGERNWGYDGVHPYAVQNSYGGPRSFQRLIDAAHRTGLGVILDVVYNHFGPEGNYLEKFGPYFTDRYHTPWGRAINYDGPYSDSVRQFVIDNATCGSAIFTSTGCGSTPCRRSTIFRRATSLPT